MTKEEILLNFRTQTETSGSAMMNFMQKPRSYDSNEHEWNEKKLDQTATQGVHRAGRLGAEEKD